MKLQFHPLTADRWPDLEELFGPKGACAGCWCMFWRQTGKQFADGKGVSNKRAFKKIVNTSRPPGVLAYDGTKPVGWCAVAPRHDYPRLDRSRVLAPVDDLPAWSVTCLFVARDYRNRGVSSALIAEAARFARKQGARIVEGYPYEPGERVPDPFAYTGIPSSFRKAGFHEVLRRSAVRPIMRLKLR